MARGPRYRVPFRRRREGKTNYRKRRIFILSRRPLAVIRRTNKRIIIQYVRCRPHGDETLIGIDSTMLKKYGWKFSFKNLPAAYLTGYMFGLLVKKNNLEPPVPYLGLHRVTRGNRLFAAIKGMLDAGLKMKVSPEVLPDEERIRGEHIVNYFRMLGEEAEKIFSAYTRNNVNVEDLPNEVERVKNEIYKDVMGEAK